MACFGEFLVVFVLFAKNQALGCGNAANIPIDQEKRLVNHVIREVIDSNPINCYLECKREKCCQSINFRQDSKTCELNNRTKDAGSDKLVYTKDAYYMPRADRVFLGSIPELPADNCNDIKSSDSSATTGWYWINLNKTGNASRLMCDMEMIDLDECTSGIHDCSVLARCSNTKGSFKCMCGPGSYGDGRNCKEIESCQKIADLKGKASGVYQLMPGGPPAIQVYCVTKSDGGAWTIIQQRQDGSVSFNRSWNEYKTGFGNPSGEFWLGLESIHRLTNQEARTLRVELEDWEGRQGYAEYSGFSVGDAAAQYNLAVSGYTGNIVDSLTPKHNGMKFTTRDRDNDLKSDYNCAVYYQSGGWWMNACFACNLNGFYHNSSTNKYAEGIMWYHWKGFDYSLKMTKMMIRPTSGWKP